MDHSIAPATILVVEDELGLHNSLRLNLELEGYDVRSAYDGAEAIKLCRSAHFDTIILDLMLPAVDGLSVLETIRLNKVDSPVLILSARNSSADRVTGLRKGADDYLTKPFELEELLLRVANLVQKGQVIRKATLPHDVYRFGGHHIDFNSQIATLNTGEKVELSKKETMLLQLLAAHANEVVTREKILQSVWGYQVYPTTRTIDNFILAFRKHFEEDSRNPKYFHSVRGVGYKFTP
ncbi:MAG TPA: response regulator transcription factor [Phnomibacter sp.]|nr:response regulator transcription factor [Phnomibacter sp.]